jgi:hypothetical protein
MAVWTDGWENLQDGCITQKILYQTVDGLQTKDQSLYGNLLEIIASTTS